MSEDFCCLSVYVYISYAEFCWNVQAFHLQTDTATLQTCSSDCQRLMIYVVYLSSCTPINIIHISRTLPLTTMCTFVFFKLLPSQDLCDYPYC